MAGNLPAPYTQKRWNPAKHQEKESTQERERKRNKVQGPESRHTKEPQRGEPHDGKETTKYQNLHWSHEAHQLKKGDVKLIKIKPLKTIWEGSVV
jgi:hypothetical protein